MARMLKCPDTMKTIKSESSSYQLENCLGEGLSSRVYRAKRYDSRGHSEQVVVLKILKNQKQVEWLRQEFAALSRLDSQYCVRVLNWENLELGPALVLEYIEGISLFDLLFQGRLEDFLVEEIIAQVQLGLLALERADRFHGDLNLKNIMIDKNGCVKLIDFASFYASPAELKNKTNEIVGTPQYLAPELWQGEERSSRSDLFALGLLEIDLKQGLQNIPSLIQDCRLRTAQFVDSDLQFLNKDPKKRIYKKIQRTLYAKKFLGRRVSQILRERLLKDQKTIIMNGVNRFPKKTQVALLCALAISCFVLPGATAPFPSTLSSALHSKQALLEIRTSQWIEVLLDGKNYGFAPVIMDKLNPGVHRLKWSAAKAHGEFKFKLESGELRILSERDFTGLIKTKRKTGERRLAGNNNFKLPVLVH